MPAEVKILARHLGLDQATVFRKHLAVGVTHMPDGSLRHGVMPHKLRDGKKPGSVWTLQELAVSGRCVFFDRGKCTIYPVRPFECARMLHSRRQDTLRLRHHIVKAWTDTELRPYSKWTNTRLFGSGKSRE